MFKAKNLIKLGAEAFDKNGPAIVMFLGVALGCMAIFKAFDAKPEILDELEEKEENLQEGEVVSTGTKIKVVAKHVWPVALYAGGSFACIVISNRMLVKKGLALAAGYKLLEKELDIREKATEKVVGKKKSEEIRSKMSDEYLDDDPVREEDVICTAGGTDLCYDPVSGRYFYSSINAIRDAVLEINELLSYENYAILNDLYYKLKLPDVKCGDLLGWSVDRDSVTRGRLLMDFDSKINKQGKPCIVMRYKVAPCYDFRGEY